MPFTWIDLTIIGIVLYYVYGGWERGFSTIFAELLSFVGSLWFAVRFSGTVGTFISQKFGLALTWANIVGYIVVAFITETIIVQLALLGLSRLPQKILSSKINRIFGGVFSAINALVFISFILLVLLSLPLRGSIKQDISSSVIAPILVRASEKFGGKVKSSLEGAAKQAATFLTIEPDSKEQLPLDLPVQMTLTLSPADEKNMVDLVNRERVSRGLNALNMDTRMTDVARGKSRDMFERRYFSHYDPDGKNAADRMDAANISYQIVGENLAYAPDLNSAHQGLMNSPGHRANILEPRYRRVGIGVINSTYYGKMFTQVFAD